MAQKVGLLVSHPIQYYSPWFRALAREIDLHVFYAHRQSAAEQAQVGFGVSFDWDIDLLSGYEYSFLRNVSAIPSVDRFSGCDTPQIRDAITNGHFDAFIVCGWYLKCYWQAVRACRRKNVPVLVRGDSQLLTPRSVLRRSVKRLLYSCLLNQFDGFLVVGKRNAEYLRHYGAPENRMFRVPHFVDNESFATRAEEARKERGRLRTLWGADDGSLVVLFVGKFIAKKRPHDLLRALTFLPRDKRNTVAVFVGSGELEESLHASVLDLGVKAHFVGFKNQTELPSYYAAAEVVVLPSASETWGLVVNEAMACGLPAIVSEAVGCAPDMIDGAQTGFTFPVGDAEQLAGCLLRFAHMKGAGHDWEPALKKKTADYSARSAVEGTVMALKACSKKNQTQQAT